MKALKLSVTNNGGAGGLRPVRGGIPIAESLAPPGSHFALLDSSGQPLSVQTSSLATWKDGSTRWLLLDFLADVAPGRTESFTIGWSDKEGYPVHAEPAVCIQASSCGGLTRIPGVGCVELVAIGSEGTEYRASVESAVEECAGPVRWTTVIRGSLRDENGRRLFGFRAWISTFASVPIVKLEPLILLDPDHGLITRIRELRLDIRTDRRIDDVSIGSEWAGDPSGGVRLFQLDDRRFEISDVIGERASGWAEFVCDGARSAVALRGFWQQWPKSIEADGESLRIGLFPRFQEGAFAHMQPWYKYDYLFEGDCYRLRTGQSRRWEIWMDMSGDGAALAEYANHPLSPAADPREAVSTGVWGDIKAAGVSPEYDVIAEAVFEGFIAALDESRDYGAMNWGDWFGERKCNWGNNEYDTARHMFLQYARTGNPKYLHAGDVVARHTAEVDTLHFVNDDTRSYYLDEVCASYTNRSITDNYPIRPGMMHAHCVGHVGGFHKVEEVRQLFLSLAGQESGNPYLCLDPYNVGHMFVQGMAYDYFLTGDPWIKETLLRIGDNLCSLVEDRKMPFTGRPCAGRELGWTMLALAAIYELDLDERRLNAMRILADDAVGEQDPNCGGWLQQLFGGHCDCITRRHVGEAGFITSIRLNALLRYYALSGDSRIPESVRRGIDNMTADRWIEQLGGWRYTSCPATPYVGQPGVTMLAMAGAVRLLGDREHLRILRKAWSTLLESLRSGSKKPGKAFGWTLFGCPETASVLADLGLDQ